MQPASALTKHVRRGCRLMQMRPQLESSAPSSPPPSSLQFPPIAIDIERAARLLFIWILSLALSLSLCPARIYLGCLSACVQARALVIVIARLSWRLSALTLQLGRILARIAATATANVTMSAIAAEAHSAAPRGPRALGPLSARRQNNHQQRQPRASLSKSLPAAFSCPT